MTLKFFFFLIIKHTTFYLALFTFKRLGAQEIYKKEIKENKLIFKREVTELIMKVENVPEN